MQGFGYFKLFFASLAPRLAVLVVGVCASAFAAAASAQTAAPGAGNGIAAQPIGGEGSFGLDDWGSIGQMIEPVWVTQGLPVQRTTVSAWQVPGKVLVLRHGSTERMKLGIKFADTVQRIEINPSTRKFTILYSYEDGRRLETTGQIENDGLFSEYLTATDGSKQRNLYVLDTPRRMRIVRQNNVGQWRTVSTATKLGETPAERVARENEERRQREAIAAAERARQEAERRRQEAEDAEREAEDEAQRQADEAEDAENRERRRQGWQDVLNGFKDIGRLAREQAEDTRQLQARIAADVARAQEQRRRQNETREPALRTVPVPRQYQQAPVQTRPAPPSQSPPAQVATMPRQYQQAPIQPPAQQTPPPPRPRPVDDNPMVSWREAVVLCEPPKSGSGEWSCHGPLQTTYGVPDKPSGAIAVRQACGSSSSNAIRDLGQSSGFRTYGCGFGSNPANAPSRDPSNRFGVFVPGRTTFTCPKKQSGVCTNRN